MIFSSVKCFGLKRALAKSPLSMIRRHSPARNHSASEVCADCGAILRYAFKRINMCPYNGSVKPACGLAGRTVSHRTCIETLHENEICWTPYDGAPPDPDYSAFVGCGRVEDGNVATTVTGSLPSIRSEGSTQEPSRPGPPFGTVTADRDPRCHGRIEPG
jgi:hypothetical protein